MAGVVPMPAKTSGRKQWTLHGKPLCFHFYVMIVTKCGAGRKS